MEYRLRAAQLKDRTAMYAISRAAHNLSDYALFIPAAQHAKFARQYRWSWRQRSHFLRRLKMKMRDQNSRVIVAEAQGVLLGYMIASFKGPNHLVLNGLFIHPRYQGQGIGAALLDASFADTPDHCTVTLEVLEENKKAQSLYVRRGFRMTRRLDKYFFGGQLIEMRRY
jgi:ribosomal protein S18 acetylase RimI-like enzyme